jgi:hypothetical protein
MRPMQKYVLSAVFVAAACTGIYEAQQASSLRTQVETLQKQQANQTQQLQDERDAATNRLAVLASENEGLKRGSLEVLKLRGEVTRLAGQQNESAKLREENQQLRSTVNSPRAAQAAAAADPDNFPKESWAFAGYATPEAAMQSAAWAMSRGDKNTFLAGLTPDEQKRMQDQWQGKSETDIAAQITNEVNGGKDGAVAGYRIVKKETLSDNEMVLTLYVPGLDPKEGMPQMKVQRVGNEWRVAGAYRGQQ